MKSFDNISIDELWVDCRACEQAPNHSVLDHGELVNKYFHDLHNHLKSNTELKYHWKLPEFVTTNKELILANLYPIPIIDEYQKLHDIGKPYCITIDESGRKHFPDHANVSYKVYKKFFNNDIVAELILHDMDIHTMTAIEIDEILQIKSPQFVMTLLLTALAEIHANANLLFGGVNTDSFKIKFKQIEKRGKRIIKNIEQL